MPMRGNLSLAAGLIALLAAQLAFGFVNRDVQPAWTALPPVPTARALDAESLGDRQLLYRRLVLDLQNFGDTGGHRTRMGEYDMAEVVKWLQALDQLDRDADHHLKLATQYFVYTPNKPGLRRLVDYVRDQVAQSPRRHWKWLPEAIYIAQMKLGDLPLAIATAEQLAGYEYLDMPLIVMQIAPVLYEQQGDYAAAAAAMNRALKAYRDRSSPDEITYMEEFIETMQALAGATPPA